MSGAAGPIVELLGVHADPQTVAAELARRYGLPLEQAQRDVAAVTDFMSRLPKSKGRAIARPTIKGAGDVLRQWWLLAPATRWAVTKTTLMTAAIEVGLRTVDIQTLANWLRTPLCANKDQSTIPRVGDIAELSDRERDYWMALNWVLARWVLPDTCLRRALLLGFFIRGRSPTLHLGIMTDGKTAHAWIEAEGRSYDMGEVSDSFGVIG